MFDGFIFRGFFLSGRGFRHLPVRQDFDGGNANLKDKNGVSRSYFFRGENIKDSESFCRGFLEKSRELNIDVFVFGKKKNKMYQSKTANLYIKIIR